MDWGLGHYERTAAQLLPAARGARVTGVDPARRLLEVARARAAEQRLDATFTLGEAAALPLDDGEADVTLSVFGMIFAQDAPAAAAEITESANYPLAVAGRAVLDARGESQALRARMLSIYEAANEDPSAFRVTSRYIVGTARRV